MVSENYPDISLAWYDDAHSEWVDIRNYCKEFNVKDAGILKVAQATITLANKGGIFTSGANKIAPFSHVRVKGDVRDVWDNIFFGRFYKYKGDYARRKHDVKLVCRGYGQRFLRDTETRDYGSTEDPGYPWTLKDVITQFLAFPDSGYDTGITLETDSGDITTKIAGEECNFDGTHLLDCLKKIAERINYDGYIKLVDSSLHLVFKEAGTVNADPAVTLMHPFVFVNPEFSIIDVKNYWLIEGGIEEGVPEKLDVWTEGAMANYDPDIWIPNNADTSVVDDATQKHEGQKSIKFSATTAGKADVTLDITKTEEEIVDASTRFVNLDFWCRIAGNPYYKTVQVEVEDDLSNKILRGAASRNEVWDKHIWGVGPSVSIDDMPGWGAKTGQWYWVVHNTDFSWKIKKIRFYENPAITDLAQYWIDGLHFKGGRKIHPLAYPVWNPPVKDDDSIAAYGRNLDRYVNESIFRKTDAQKSGQIILALRKEPHIKLTCKKGAKIWVKPSQVVTLNVPEYEINSEARRVLEIETDWKSSSKTLRTTFTLVPATYKVSTQAFLEDAISGLLKRE